MRRLSPDRIALLRPFGRLAPRQVYPLPPAKIHPIIRIAHRRRGALHIQERVILDHEFVLFLDGRGEIRIGDEKPREFAAHHLYLLPPFVPHVIMTEMCEHVAVHFDVAAGFPPFGKSLGRREPYEVQFPHGLALPRHLVTSPSDQIEEMFLELVRASEAGEPLAELRATKSVGGVRWSGVHEVGAEYVEGELVTRGGLWLACATTTATPGSDPTSWTLIVRAKSRDAE